MSYTCRLFPLYHKNPQPKTQKKSISFLSVSQLILELVSQASFEPIPSHFIKFTCIPAQVTWNLTSASATWTSTHHHLHHRSIQSRVRAINTCLLLCAGVDNRLVYHSAHHSLICNLIISALICTFSQPSQNSSLTCSREPVNLGPFTGLYAPGVFIHGLWRGLFGDLPQNFPGIPLSHTGPHLTIFTLRILHTVTTCWNWCQPPMERVLKILLHCLHTFGSFWVFLHCHHQ